MLKSDNNLRNFIYANNTVYGLDFEDCSWGFIEEDIGQVCAYILANRPAFSGARLSEISSLVREYFLYDNDLSFTEIKRIILEELLIMAQRRKEASAAILDFLKNKGDFEL
jgi:hypothetical protein